MPTFRLGHSLAAPGGLRAITPDDLLLIAVAGVTALTVLRREDY